MKLLVAKSYSKLPRHSFRTNPSYWLELIPVIPKSRIIMRLSSSSHAFSPHLILSFIFRSPSIRVILSYSKLITFPREAPALRLRIVLFMMFTGLTTPDDVNEIVDLWIYPIKSCRGISLKKALVTKQGLELDRRWMFVDAESNKSVWKLESLDENMLTPS